MQLPSSPSSWLPPMPGVVVRWPASAVADARATCCSSPSTRCAPTASAATATRRRRRRTSTRSPRRGLRFTQATTVVPLTLPAHSSLLTGTFPAWHGVRDNGGFYLGDDQLTLAEVLKDKGFRTGGLRLGVRPRPPLGHRAGVRALLRRLRPREVQQGARAWTPSSARAARRSSRRWPGSARTGPGLSSPGCTSTTRTRPTKLPSRTASRFPRDAARAPTTPRSRSTDAQVGRLLDALARQGRLEDTLVVVLADHGEMLGEHGEQTHGFFIYDARRAHPADRWPGPGLAPRAISDQVRIVDVMPTALELLGVARPAAVQGDEPAAARARAAAWPGGALRELVSALSLRLERAALGAGRALQAHPGPAARALRPRRRTRGEAQRPGGRRCGAGAVDARRARRLRKPHHARRCSQGAAPVDAETEEKLAALGYVGSVSARHLEGAPACARRSQGQDRALQPAEAGRERLGRRRPGRSDSARCAARCASRPDDRRGLHAARQLPAARRSGSTTRWPPTGRRWRSTREHQNALFSLAVAYKDGNRLEDARLGFERARALDPRNGKVLWQLADLALRQKRPQDAEAVIQRRARAQGGRAPLPAEARRELHRVEALRGSGEGTEGGAREKGRPAPRRSSTSASSTKTPAAPRWRSPPIAPNWRERPPRTARPSIWPSFWRARANWPRPPPSFARPSRSIPTSAPGSLYLAKALLDANDLPGAEARSEEGARAKPRRADGAPRPLRPGGRLLAPGARAGRAARGGLGEAAGAAGRLATRSGSSRPA